MDFIIIVFSFLATVCVLFALSKFSKCESFSQEHITNLRKLSLFPLDSSTLAKNSDAETLMLISNLHWVSDNPAWIDLGNLHTQCDVSVMPVALQDVPFDCLTTRGKQIFQKLRVDEDAQGIRCISARIINISGNSMIIHDTWWSYDVADGTPCDYVLLAISTYDKAIASNEFNGKVLARCSAHFNDNGLTISDGVWTVQVGCLDIFNFLNVTSFYIGDNETDRNTFMKLVQEDSRYR